MNNNFFNIISKPSLLGTSLRRHTSESIKAKRPKKDASVDGLDDG